MEIRRQARPAHSLEEVRARLRAEMPTLRRRWSVEQLGIFGSYVRGEQREGSDLDLLVTFTEVPGLFDYIGLQHHLEDLLGLSVDIGMPGELKRFVRAQAEREAEWL